MSDDGLAAGRGARAGEAATPASTITDRQALGGAADGAAPNYKNTF